MPNTFERPEIRGTGLGLLTPLLEPKPDAVDLMRERDPQGYAAIVLGQLRVSWSLSSVVMLLAFPVTLYTLPIPAASNDRGISAVLLVGGLVCAIGRFVVPRAMTRWVLQADRVSARADRLSGAVMAGLAFAWAPVMLAVVGLIVFGQVSVGVVLVVEAFMLWAVSFPRQGPWNAVLSSSVDWPRLSNKGIERTASALD